jgi:hypothetical protein
MNWNLISDSGNDRKVRRYMEPFQDKFVVSLNANIANGGTYKTVPSGKLLVIEHVSVDASVGGAALLGADYYITSTIEGSSAYREVPIITQKTPTGLVHGSHPLRAYAASGTQFGGVIRRFGDLSQTIIASFVIAGYYVPAP